MKQQLDKRVAQEFELRNTPINTRLTYRRCIARFERHFGKSAAQLGREHVRAFLLHLVEHEKLSPSTHNVHAAALFFLYTQVLGRPQVVEKLPRRKMTRKLPSVPTAEEIEMLLAAIRSPMHRAVFARLRCGTSDPRGASSARGGHRQRRRRHPRALRQTKSRSRRDAGSAIARGASHLLACASAAGTGAVSGTLRPRDAHA